MGCITVPIVEDLFYRKIECLKELMSIFSIKYEFSSERSLFLAVNDIFPIERIKYPRKIPSLETSLIIFE